MSDENTVDTVPKARFDAVIGERRAAEARAAAAEARVAELTPLQARLEAMSKDLDAWKAKESAWSDERTILGAGITDPDGVDFTRHAWGRLAPEARPEGGLKAWLSEPARLPKAVQAYLPTTPVAASAPAAQTPAAQSHSGQMAQLVGAAPVLPPSNTNVLPGQAPTGKLTADQIKSYAQAAAEGRISKAEWQTIAQQVLSGQR